MTAARRDLLGSEQRFDRLSSLRALARTQESLSLANGPEGLAHALRGEFREVLECEDLALFVWSEHDQRLEAAAEGPDADRARLRGTAGAAAMLRRPVRKPGPDAERGDDAISELAVPLLAGKKLVGVVYASRGAARPFEDHEEAAMGAISTPLALALENQRLRTSAKRRDERSARDLETAREIQSSLLTGSPPRIHGIDVGTAYRPVKALGGDFFDFLPLPERRLAIAIGDVSGKGTPAALFGSMAVGMLRGLVVEATLRPERMLRRLNERLQRPATDVRFVAMAYAVFDPARSTLTIANAGFARPFLVRDRRLEKIDVRGTPLGLLPDSTYDETTLDLDRGDIVIFCSDGLQEAIDGLGEQFGDRFLEDVVEALLRVPAQQIAEGLVRASTAYAGHDEELADDRSVVVLKVG